MNMNGWDTVYALNIVNANQALASSLSQLVPGVQGEISGVLGNYTVSVEFGAWQIALGGSSQLINLQVPIIGGSITSTGGQSISLKGYTALFSVSLKLLTSAPQQQALRFDFTQAGTLGQSPAPGVVVPLGFVGAAPDPTVGTLALNAIATGLVAQAAKLHFAFAQINLVPSGANSWLAPHQLAYAFFANLQNQGFLAILSTTGDPTRLPVTVDPQLTAGGTAGFAFSLPLFFRNCVIPQMAATLPSNPVNKFVVNNNVPPQVVLTSGTGLGHVKVGAITYHPSMDGFCATPGVNQMRINVNGGCNVRAGLSMSWSGNVTNSFQFNAQKQTIDFVAGSPSLRHNIRIPWYYWLLSPIITAIAKGVASLIGNSIASFIKGKVGAGLMSAAPPTSVQFAGMKQFHVTGAVFDGAVILTGQPGQ
ncbi:TULIP family P47-like protein [Xylophilus sp. GW821-FHT01B05]